MAPLDESEQDRVIVAASILLVGHIIRSDPRLATDPLGIIAEKAAQAKQVCAAVSRHMPPKKRKRKGTEP